MPDHSHLDDKYFVDRHKYNCPFCRRRHVSFSVSQVVTFNWTDEKRCMVIFVKCDSCSNISMHLSFHTVTHYRNSEHVFVGDEIDEKIFYSVPTSLHAIDSRIPREIRELVAEAEGCLKSNFLTGASACVRKVVYELAIKEGAEGSNY